MKNLLILALIALSSACAHYKHTHEQHQFVPSERSMLTESKSSVLRLADELAHELTVQSLLFAEDVPVVVMTPVMANDFTRTVNFSAVLQQSLMTSLKMRGYQVTDVNATDALKVTANGEFMLARDWQLLPHNLSVEHAVVSTVELNKNGIVLNSRVINLNDNSVLSAAEASLPVSEFSQYVMPSEKVVVRDGVVFRYSKTGQENVRQLGVK
ncbi:hypothetical protein JQC92_13670 [Shewanella sp. 202IG2-18]|uniref:FlgO family outer membrane protein n=1 Tax=Parashewanella hymeniacidonis TaxID=2807618 RepID=UPI0019616271|nr:FlgO family outer membrane protein [Parashewanella hymeniacidonis]MBM7073065.1 hypothetical protein [Parashewanella hymeniacidonis]